MSSYREVAVPFAFGFGIGPFSKTLIGNQFHPPAIPPQYCELGDGGPAPVYTGFADFQQLVTSACIFRPMNSNRAINGDVVRTRREANEDHFRAAQAEGAPGRGYPPGPLGFATSSCGVGVCWGEYGSSLFVGTYPPTAQRIIRCT